MGLISDSIWQIFLQNPAMAGLQKISAVVTSSPPSQEGNCSFKCFWKGLLRTPALG